MQSAFLLFQLLSALAFFVVIAWIAFLFVRAYASRFCIGGRR
jgi:hypothetical protein